MFEWILQFPLMISVTMLFFMVTLKPSKSYPYWYGDPPFDNGTNDGASKKGTNRSVDAATASNDTTTRASNGGAVNMNMSPQNHTKNKKNSDKWVGQLKVRQLMGAGTLKLKDNYVVFGIGTSYEGYCCPFQDILNEYKDQYLMKFFDLFRFWIASDPMKLVLQL